MALVDRRMLQEQICEKIAQRPSICSEDKCLCFEQIKDELKYSILSHRWGSPELTFSEFVKLHEQITWRFWDGLKSPDTRALERMHEIWGDTPFKRSLAKLLHFRQVSAQRQCKYAWVDTICINKESSSELDESIRSMYVWYRDAHICIVHLNQTPYYLDMTDEPWFSRGWTLQELLAPKQIKFYSASWKGITRRENDKDLDSAEQQAAKEGKDNPSLWSTIHQITGIPIEDLLDFKPGLYDIGKRMDWASKRTTTRIEDMAYCLIGVFQINLSIAYGEKEGAFYRLQVEIMQNSDDQSLFKWHGTPSAYNSMFAASPKCFSRSLGLSTDAATPSNDGEISTLAANFERRVSRILYYKYDVPDLEIWADSEATAFTVLGPSSNNSGEYTVMILVEQNDVGQRDDQLDNPWYKRLKVVETKIDRRRLPKKNPSEIVIK